MEWFGKGASPQSGRLSRLEEARPDYAQGFFFSPKARERLRPMRDVRYRQPRSRTSKYKRLLGSPKRRLLLSTGRLAASAASSVLLLGPTDPPGGPGQTSGQGAGAPFMRGMSGVFLPSIFYLRFSDFYALPRRMAQVE